MATDSRYTGVGLVYNNVTFNCWFSNPKGDLAYVA